MPMPRFLPAAWPHSPPHPALPVPLTAGGWYDPQDGAGGRGGNYVMSPAGSPPAMVESFMEEAGRCVDACGAGTGCARSRG